ncbi:hypothetical protein [Rossellomorea arthrocnemi]|jgi:hypothetical protein|uniref:hypothetical protein n=1 Tax=Rossellomorea arthrocnemi TaxID=2769542 RepID=UPI00191B2C30|nr:hypothetical protein [Rossellomorea arthrocnemi]
MYLIEKSTQDLVEAKDIKDVFLIEAGVEKKVGETTEEIKYYKWMVSRPFTESNCYTQEF